MKATVAVIQEGLVEEPPEADRRLWLRRQHEVIRAAFHGYDWPLVLTL
jgi:hypothetical protein